MDPFTLPELLKLVGAIIAPLGAVTVAAVKYSLNGSRKQIAEIHSDVKDARKDRDEIKEAVYGLNTRIAVVESKMDVVR